VWVERSGNKEIASVSFPVFDTICFPSIRHFLNVYKSLLQIHSHLIICFGIFQDLVDELRRQRVLEERLPAAGDPRRPGVNFINILGAAFSCKDPKSTKRL